MERRAGAVLLAAVLSLAALAPRAHAEGLPETGEGSLVYRTAEGRYEAVPLRHTDVQIDVRGLVASATVTQVYENHSPTPVEATYVFPLPHDAAVYEMEMRIGDRVVRSVVKEREQARRTYEAAARSGQRAALVEEERPNIFTTSLANLMPGDHVEVRLSYVEPLAWDDGRVRLVFPMVVGPRYIPGEAHDSEGDGSEDGDPMATASQAPPDADRITPPLRRPDVRPGHDLTLRVSADLGAPLVQVASPSHEIEWERQGRGVTARLAQRTTLPNRDFVLELQREAAAGPQTALFLSPAGAGDETHFMLVAYPPSVERLQQRAPLDLVFLIDVSGSMEGTSIQQARAALLQGLDRLRPGDRFNVVAYSDAFHALSEASLAATGENLENGRRFVRGLAAGGGTELLPALQHVLADAPAEGVTRYIVLLTDGDLGNEDQIFNALERGLGAARLFTVAIGSAPNHHLATRMAEYGRGSFTHIADVSEVQAQMGKLLDQVDSPVLTGVSLQWEGAEATDVFPTRLPDLFLRQPLVVYGRLPGGARGRLRVSARQGSSDYAQDLPFAAQEARFHPGITSLWARQAVKERMDEWRRAASDEEREPFRLQVVELGTRYHLVTRFTSLVAVEEVVANATGTLQQTVVPTELPQGWVMEKVVGDNPQGGSADLFLEALGAALLTLGLALALVGAALAPRRTAARPVRS